MPRRLFKYINGELVQTEGPLFEGPKQTLGEMVIEGLEEAIKFERGELAATVRKVNAPAVIIPKKHRSAG